MFNLWLIAL